MTRPTSRQSNGVFCTMDRGLARVEGLWLAIAALAVVLMMIFTALDVVLRYGLNSPLTWWYDLLMNYVLIAAFFLPFSHTLAQHAHLAVEYFSQKMNPRVGDALLCVGFSGSAAALAVVTVSITHEAYGAWLHDDVIAGVILWPVWVSRAIVAAAMLPLACRCAYFAAAHAARALRSSAIDLPRLRTSSSKESEALA